MADYSLRPATEADFPEIKALIRQVRINPMGLDWRRFTVAIDRPVLSEGEGPVLSEGEGPVLNEGEGGGKMIGCAQLKPVPGGLTELASLAVRPAYRKQGIARALIEHLLEESPRPVYLTCRSRLGKLYEKFGFRTLEAEEMPSYYRRLHRLATVFFRMTGKNETLLVMKLG